MRRSLILLLAVALVSLGATAARAWAKPTVQLRHTAKGKILVDSRGFTLYVFSRDSRNHDACVRISHCVSLWPPLKVSGRPTAGPGVSARLLGTIKLGRARQVTYAGHPLYSYVGDSSPGETSYVGLNQAGGFWYALTAAGKVIK